MRRWASVLKHESFGRTAHSAGGSPLEGSRLPPAKILVIEERPDGYFLTRYTGSGVFGGDTWHRDLNEAKGQARYEFDQEVSDWSEVPPDEIDLIAYVRQWSEP